ncbi:hypothetical protein PRIPAC_78081 [Pristionchus pacificus]|uniref:Uncharacterized protein n=1 Tax=Pristionchus pacificus TaxID=54126 RepID=A0A2A6CKC3_PRIPA|nr:hypothetical protein PRIPAC_78081 [Pristionchus pacificus]|eukprot:PDM78527.1 hypothetical protein PRIPAC_31106 [Pristionchus pacificus]
MLRWGALLLALSTLAASASINGTTKISKLIDANCSPDFKAITKSCLDAYFTGFGLNPAKLPPYKDYVNIIVDLTTNFGKNGADDYCSKEVSVETCLGPLFNSACMTGAAFQDMYGMSQIESYEYATDFPVRAYMCDNKKFMEDNLACFDSVYTTHLDDRKKCTDSVEKAIQNVADGDYCKPWGPFVQCLDDVYVKYCGDKVKGYICNVMEVGINFDSMNACKSTLPKCATYDDVSTTTKSGRSLSYLLSVVLVFVLASM